MTRCGLPTEYLPVPLVAKRCAEVKKTLIASGFALIRIGLNSKHLDSVTLINFLIDQATLPLLLYFY